MLTITLSDPKHVLLADALEASLEAAPIQPDPDAPAALTLLAQLREPEDMANDPSC